MKAKLLIVALLITQFAFSQSASKYVTSKDGFTDYVVTEVPGKSKEELYTKVIEWLNKTYKNPKEVIKAQIENDYIRIEGIKSNMLCVISGASSCFDVRYQIEISFKDGRYKFDVTKIEQYAPPSRVWLDIPINGDFKGYFKESGEIKPMFKLLPDAFQSTFNGLNKDLESFLKSESIPSKKGNW